MIQVPGTCTCTPYTPHFIRVHGIRRQHGIPSAGRLFRRARQQINCQTSECGTLRCSVRAPTLWLHSPAPHSWLHRETSFVLSQQSSTWPSLATPTPFHWQPLLRARDSAAGKHSRFASLSVAPRSNAGLCPSADLFPIGVDQQVHTLDTVALTSASKVDERAFCRPHGHDFCFQNPFPRVRPF